jgi:hypothetical protein
VTSTTAISTLVGADQNVRTWFSLLIVGGFYLGSPKKPAQSAGPK